MASTKASVSICTEWVYFVCVWTDIIFTWKLNGFVRYGLQTLPCGMNNLTASTVTILIFSKSNVHLYYFHRSKNEEQPQGEHKNDLFENFGKFIDYPEISTKDDDGQRVSCQALLDYYNVEWQKKFESVKKEKNKSGNDEQVELLDISDRTQLEEAVVSASKHFMIEDTSLYDILCNSIFMSPLESEIPEENDDFKPPRCESTEHGSLCLDAGKYFYAENKFLLRIEYPNIFNPYKQPGRHSHYYTKNIEGPKLSPLARADRVTYIKPKDGLFRGKPYRCTKA